MTREEAINYAEAIKARTQEKIEFYRRGNAHAPEVYYSDLAFLSAAISALREQEERRWIPVTERLPEESGMYIVTANDGHEQRVSFVLWQKKNRMWNLTGARSYWRVTHWQPMPQPTKGE